MELVTVEDEQKNKCTFKRYNGYPFFKFFENVGELLNKAAHCNIKEDDVLVCVFPKSGTHWLYNTVMMLRTKSLKYHGTPRQWLGSNDVIEKMESPRTFASHLRFRFLPEEMKLGKGKVVTIVRNPKDIVVSFYLMMQKLQNIGYEGTFDGFLKVFVSEECFFGNGSWFSWIKDMEDWDGGNFLCLSYSDFKQNTFENVVKLAKFLELDHDEEFLRSVTENIQFDKLKESHNLATPLDDSWKHISEDEQIPIYRKGQTGEWKKMFTVAQSEEFNKLFKEKVAELGLKIDISFE